MSAVLGMLTPFGFGVAGKPHYDDDFVDRLNHTYSVLLLIMMSVIVTTGQYVGDPIHCWIPGYFTGNYESYSNKICWVSNTYYLPYNEDIPKPLEDRKMINYYQWVPLGLLLQAVLFYLPRVFWRNFNYRAGVDVNNIVDAAQLLPKKENREITLRYMMQQVDRYLGHFKLDKPSLGSSIHKMLSRHCHCFCGRRWGTYLVSLYLFVKLCYLFNVLTQLFMLDTFLGTDFHLYGFYALHSMLSAAEWPGSSRFPHSTMCDFRIRQLGNLQRYTVQCVLPINFYNEKIYLLIWFWLVVVTLVTAYSLLLWTFRLVIKRDHMTFVRCLLKAVGKIKKDDQGRQLKGFVEEYLRHDGVLVLRLVEINTNELTVAELTEKLWDYYRSNPDRLNNMHDDPEDSPAEDDDDDVNKSILPLRHDDEEAKVGMKSPSAPLAYPTVNNNLPTPSNNKDNYEDEDYNKRLRDEQEHRDDNNDNSAWE